MYIRMTLGSPYLCLYVVLYKLMFYDMWCCFHLYRPLEDTKAPEDSVATIDDETAALGVDQPPKIVVDEYRDSVEGGAGEGVEGGAGEGVEGGAGDGVEGGPGDNVEGGPGDSVKSEARDNVDGEPIKAQQTVQESVSITISNNETENVGASESGEAIKERGDYSPSVNAAGRRSGRRRNKFKPITPQD